MVERVWIMVNDRRGITEGRCGMHATAADARRAMEIYCCVTWKRLSAAGWRAVEFVRADHAVVGEGKAL